MSLHDDLLSQAQHLLHREKRRPKQASLRRAVSAAYYALFHLLIAESSRMLVSNPSLRSLVSRTFIHAEMNKTSRSFAGGNLPRKFDAVTEGKAVPNALRNVANVFSELQQARHLADYDLAKKFSRGEAQVFVDQASRAFQDWQTIRKDDQAQLYLACLLLWDRWDKIR